MNNTTKNKQVYENTTREIDRLKEEIDINRKKIELLMRRVDDGVTPRQKTVKSVAISAYKVLRSMTRVLFALKWELGMAFVMMNFKNSIVDYFNVLSPFLLLLSHMYGPASLPSYIMRLFKTYNIMVAFVSSSMTLSWTVLKTVYTIQSYVY